MFAQFLACGLRKLLQGIDLPAAAFTVNSSFNSGTELFGDELVAIVTTMTFSAQSTMASPYALEASRMKSQ
jgi:hypothetical protein